MLTMWPVPRGFIRRIASCVPWITACTLISSWREMLASSSSSSAVTIMIPALLMRMSIGPRRCSTSSRKAVKPGRSVTSRARPIEPLSQLGGGGLGGAGVEIADGDDDPLASERTGERLTDATGAARDDGDLAAQRAGSLGHGVNYGEAFIVSLVLCSGSQEGAVGQIRAERPDVAAEEHRAAIGPQLQPGVAALLDRPLLRRTRAIRPRPRPPGRGRTRRAGARALRPRRARPAGAGRRPGRGWRSRARAISSVRAHLELRLDVARRARPRARGGRRPR